MTDLTGMSTEQFVLYLFETCGPVEMKSKPKKAKTVKVQTKRHEPTSQPKHREKPVSCDYDTAVSFIYRVGVKIGGINPTFKDYKMIYDDPEQRFEGMPSPWRVNTETCGSANWKTDLVEYCAKNSLEPLKPRPTRMPNPEREAAKAEKRREMEDYYLKFIYELSVELDRFADSGDLERYYGNKISQNAINWLGPLDGWVTKLLDYAERHDLPKPPTKRLTRREKLDLARMSKKEKVLASQKPLYFPSRSPEKKWDSEQLLKILYEIGMEAGGVYPNTAILRDSRLKHPDWPVRSIYQRHLGDLSDCRKKLDEYCVRNGLQKLQSLEVVQKEKQEALEQQLYQETLAEYYEVCQELGYVANSSEVDEVRGRVLQRRLLKYLGRVSTWKEQLQTYCAKQGLEMPPDSPYSYTDKLKMHYLEHPEKVTDNLKNFVSN